MKPSDLAKLGESHGRLWYAHSLPAVRLVGLGDVALGAALLAATSPRCTLVDNVRRALLRHSPLPTHRGNLIRAMRGLPLSGPKVRAFAAALSGDESTVTIDVWIARAFREDPDLNLGTYRKLTSAITRLAHKHHTAPRDYAAMIWCGTLIHHGREPLNYAQAFNLLRQKEAIRATNAA